MLTVPEEVKELLKSDSVKKNFRISFPNGERDDIINDNLVKESVSFTESVCSQNTLKYGLSEASTLSFQTVGVENIKGYVIDAEIEIDASDITVCTYSVGTLNSSNTELTTSIVTGQDLYLTSDDSAGVSYSITVTNSDGESGGTIGYWYSIEDKTVTLDDLAELVSFDDAVSADITMTLLGTSTSLDVQILEDISVSIQESDDVDYPYYPISYGRFIVDSCKRSGEMEQRQVECYAIQSSGISDIFQKIMSSNFYPVSSYPIYDMNKFIASCLFKNGVPEEYISSSSDTYTDIGLPNYSEFSYMSLYDSEGNEYKIRTTGYAYCKRYGTTYPTNNYGRLYQIEVSQCDNYPSLLEDMISQLDTALQEYGTDFTYDENGNKIFQDNKTAFKKAIETTIKPYIMSGGCLYLTDSQSTPLYIGRNVIFLDSGTTVVYSQEYHYYNPDYVADDNIYRAELYQLRYVASPRLTNIRILDSSSSLITTITLDEYPFTVNSISELELNSLGIVPDDFSYTFESTGNSTFTYSSQYYYEGYRFTDYDIMDSVDVNLLELSAIFSVNAREGINALCALNDESQETITSSEYSSLWYDDEKVQQIMGASYQYTDTDSESQSGTYGIEKIYDLTSNIVVSSYTDEDSITSVLEEYFIPQAVYSEYIPYNLTCIGLPYLEAGDYITVQDKEGNEFNTYIMRQTISGIQHLTSSMEAQSIDI